MLNACLAHSRTYTSYLSLTRAYAPLLSSGGALCAFVLYWVVLLQLKGKVRFVCALQLTILPSILSHVFFYKLFLFFFILSHWLHHHLYNYSATATFWHFQFCVSFQINLTNIQFNIFITRTDIVKLICIIHIYIYAYIYIILYIYTYIMYYIMYYVLYA